MPNKRLLAIETTTEALSVALWLDGQVLEHVEQAPRRHAAEVLPQSQRLLAEAQCALGDLDALAAGTGPGSFTGVRIGIALLQGLAMGSDLPVFGVSSLKALAWGVHRETGHADIAAIADARMGQVYASLAVWQQCATIALRLRV